MEYTVHEKHKTSAPLLGDIILKWLIMIISVFHFPQDFFSFCSAICIYLWFFPTLSLKNNKNESEIHRDRNRDRRSDNLGPKSLKILPLKSLQKNGPLWISSGADYIIWAL